MASRGKKLLWSAWLGLLLAAGGPGAVLAARVEAVTVTHAGSAYHITLDAVVDAPEQRVYQVLADYPHLGKLNPLIAAISVRPAPAGEGERVRSVLNACVWFFCRSIVEVEDVTEPDQHTIVGRIVPGEGDFQGGSWFWHLSADGTRTRLHYEANRVIDFWVPPLIGPWAIARTLREQLAASIAALERIANQPRF